MERGRHKMAKITKTITQTSMSPITTPITFHRGSKFFT